MLEYTIYPIVKWHNSRIRILVAIAPFLIKTNEGFLCNNCILNQLRVYLYVLNMG